MTIKELEILELFELKLLIIIFIEDFKNMYIFDR